MENVAKKMSSSVAAISANLIKKSIPFCSLNPAITKKTTPTLFPPPTVVLTNQNMDPPDFHPVPNPRPPRTTLPPAVLIFPTIPPETISIPPDTPNRPDFPGPSIFPPRPDPEPPLPPPDKMPPLPPPDILPPTPPDVVPPKPDIFPPPSTPPLPPPSPEINPPPTGPFIFFQDQCSVEF